MKEITENEEFIYITKKGKRYKGKIGGLFMSLSIKKMK